MNRIATRFVVGVLLTLIFGWVVDRGLIRPYRVQVRRAYAAQVFGGLVHLLRHRISALPPAQAQAEMKELDRQLGHPVRILPRAGFKLSATERRRLDQGEVLVRGQNQDPVVVLAQSWQPGQLLVLGPLASPNTRQKLFDIISSAVGLVSGVLVALFVALPLVRRLYRLERVAARIARGELGVRSQDQKNDEMGILARRFNRMADSLEDLLGQQKQLLRAVSHELRTPIARLRFDLELLDSVHDEAARQQKISSMSADIDELESLVAELLVFLRYRRAVLEKTPQAINLKELLDTLKEKYQPLRTDVALRETLSESAKHVEFIAEISGLTRALGNLLANALRFAEQRVELSIQVEHEQVTICVDDDGPGIAPDKRVQVFEPFYRVDEDRSRDSGGTGLGLAIVQSIVVAHGGKIHIEDSPLGGARFVSQWPIRPL